MITESPIEVGSVPIIPCGGHRDASRLLLDASTQRLAVSVRFVNAYSVACASQDPDYMEILKESGWNFADGVPVAWLGRRKSGLHGFGCTRGPSTFVQTLHDSVDVACVSHFFIGSSDESLKEMLRVIERDFPGVRVAGAFSPPFGPVSESLIDECEQRIKSSGASLVWVALGTPKQDFFTDVLSRRVNLPCAGVGAAFDFLSGSVKEAPSFLRGTGVEWLYRLAAEPQRLWRRYTFGTARFLFAVARDGGLFSRGGAPEAR